MDTDKEIAELNREWADAGDDVPVYLAVIRALKAENAALKKAVKRHAECRTNNLKEWLGTEQEYESLREAADAMRDAIYSVGYSNEKLRQAVNQYNKVRG